MQGNILDRYVYLETIFLHIHYFLEAIIWNLLGFLHTENLEIPCNQRIKGDYPQEEYDLNIGTWLIVHCSQLSPHRPFDSPNVSVTFSALKFWSRLMSPKVGWFRHFEESGPCSFFMYFCWHKKHFCLRAMEPCIPKCQPHSGLLEHCQTWRTDIREGGKSSISLSNIHLPLLVCGCIFVRLLGRIHTSTTGSTYNDNASSKN